MIITSSITIDGLSGVGKSAVANQIANRLNFTHLSIGLVVRAVAWLSLVSNKRLHNLDIENLSIVPGEDRFPRIIYKEEEINNNLYGNPAIEEWSPVIGKNIELQNQFYKKIREYCSSENVVLEGRNANKILPNATMKVFLWASKAERVKRNKQINRISHSCTKDEYIDLVTKRDLQDLTRSEQEDPLRIYEDMILWDSSKLQMEDTIEGIVRYFKHYTGEVPFKASVIIPVRNRSEYLDICLTNLLNQSAERTDYEVIVVNDGSEEDVLSIAEKHNVKIITTTAKGPSHARNTGVKYATGDIIIFLDGDMIVDHDFIKHQINYHSKSNDLIILGSRRHLPEGIKEVIKETRLDSREVLLNLHSFDLGYLNYPWSLAYTCNISLPSSLAKQEEFDESMIGWGIEDIEWAYRLFNGRGRFFFVRDLLGLHLYHSRDMDQAKFQQWQFNLNVFLNKHKNSETRRFEMFDKVFNPETSADFMEVYKKFNNSKIKNQKAKLLDLTNSNGNQSLTLQNIIFNLDEKEDTDLIVIDTQDRFSQYVLILPFLREYQSIRFFLKEDWERFKEEILADYLVVRSINFFKSNQALT